MTHNTHKTENQHTSRPIIHEIWLFLGLIALGVVLWFIAYQVPIHVRLAIGGDTTTHRREYDAPFLHGFNHSEPYNRKHVEWWTLEPGYAYRWASSDAYIRIPGIGSQQWVLTLLATSGRPDNTATTSTWHIGTRTLPPIELPASSRVYHVLATPDAMGNLIIHMHTPRFETPEDPRDLGFALRQVTVAPTRQTLRHVSLAQIGWLAATLVFIYPLSRWLALRVRQALLLSLTYVILTTMFLATYRMALTLFTPTLAALALSCWALGAMVVAIVGACRRQAPTFSRQAPTFLNRLSQNGTIKPLVALILLAFALRLGGMLHPHAIFSDHRLNANNLFDTTRGTIYFTEGLPSETGGGQAPYPPATYVLMAPLQLLAPTTMDGRVLVVQSSVAFFDSLVLALLWGIVCWAGLPRRAAYIAAALYLAPAPIMKSFSIGEYANIGGQAVAIPAIVLLARFLPQGKQRYTEHTQSMQDKKRQNRDIVWFVPVLCVALLGHMGVALSLGLVLIAWWCIHALRLLREALRGKRGEATFTTVTLTMRMLRSYTLYGFLVATITVLVYYSAPLFVQTFAARMWGNTDAASHTSAPTLEMLATIAKELFAGHGKLVPHLVACSIAGLLLLWQRDSSPPSPPVYEEGSDVSPLRAGGMGGAFVPSGSYSERPTLVKGYTEEAHGLLHMLLAWWFGVLLSFGLLLVAQQGVRWQHFLYPALCLSAGPLLATLARRGIAGRIVGWYTMLIPILYGLQLWIHHLYTYLHE